MDLKQQKLTKSEWNSIELNVSNEEKEVLTLIAKGYHDVNIKINKTESLFGYLKIDFNPSLENYLFNKYFLEKIAHLIAKHNLDYICLNSDKKKQSLNNADIYAINIDTIVKLKSIDSVRVSRFDVIDETVAENIYEYVLLGQLEKMLKYFKRNDNKWHTYYYTINKLTEITVDKTVHYIKDICRFILNKLEDRLDLLYILKKSDDIIEKNKNLLKFGDLSLYTHQKQLFNSIKQSGAKLILYIAPTSTGKTVSPLGISETKRLIFVCAARHVGLSLAKSAISIGKKIAFAFGCSSTSDIRLHYFAATNYTKNRKSGQIQKVDNSVGDKVEIIICDVRSYLHAMYYMMAFNEPSNIVTYWDEPTISMDYDNHPLHKIIKRNWMKNEIPNVVLSSATLPKLSEIELTIEDFKDKFTDSQGNIPTIVNIVSHDCRKTIPLIDNNGYIIMPHYLHENYSDILNVVRQCEDNLTLLRYIDLYETSSFCLYVEQNNLSNNSAKFARNFASINDIDMTSIKIYYLKVLKNILPNKWPQVYNYFQVSRTKKIHINNTVDLRGNKQTLKKIASVDTKMQVANEQINNSGIYVTTRDAYTLTDGPTIFLAEDLNKIAKFCIQQANIPLSVMNDIQNKISMNNQINEQISALEREIELEENKLTSKMEPIEANSSSRTKQSKTKVVNKILNKSGNKKINQLSERLDNLKSAIYRATLNDIFIPNTSIHREKWAEGLDTSRSFASSIDDETIKSIMLLDVDDSWKILLLLGIGVFTSHDNIEYSEIIKQLADKQKLYLIIAGGDYIFGTNYQFCHGFLGTDLKITQEKIIQSMGRIGRNNIQQDYTIRFRNMSQVSTLFQHLNFNQKPEVLNMNMLFNSKNIRWNKDIEEYEEYEPDDGLKQDTDEDVDDDENVSDDGDRDRDDDNASDKKQPNKRNYDECDEDEDS